MLTIRQRASNGEHPSLGRPPRPQPRPVPPRRSPRRWQPLCFKSRGGIIPSTSRKLVHSLGGGASPNSPLAGTPDSPSDLLPRTPAAPHCAFAPRPSCRGRVQDSTPVPSMLSLPVDGPDHAQAPSPSTCLWAPRGTECRGPPGGPGAQLHPCKPPLRQSPSGTPKSVLVVFSWSLGMWQGGRSVCWLRRRGHAHPVTGSFP